MMNFISLLKYLKFQSEELRKYSSILKEIHTENPNAIEYPFLQIDGPNRIVIDSGSSIGKHAWLGCYDNYLDERYSPRLSIGKNVRIGNYVTITAVGRISIGDGCLFSDFVYVSDHAHGANPESDLPPQKQKLENKGDVNIGPNCFLGMKVSVLPNVTLGNNCIVGAHSVVTKSFPPYSMIAGAPAKLIKIFSFERHLWEQVS